MRELKLTQILMSTASTQPALFLQDTADANRIRGLEIFIDMATAISIRDALSGAPPLRPNSHDLLVESIRLLGGRIRCVTITQLKNDTYFAVLVVETANGHREIDARPSDAVAIALRAQCPIYAEDPLFETNAKTIILRDDGTIEYATGEKKLLPPPTISEEERQRLKAFEDAFKDIDLDPDKGK